jgi:hypothetical protein
MASRLMVLGNAKVPLHILRNPIIRKCNGMDNTKLAAYNMVFNKREGGFFGFDLKGEEGIAVDHSLVLRDSQRAVFDKGVNCSGLVNGFFPKDQSRVVEAAKGRLSNYDDDNMEVESDGSDEGEFDDYFESNDDESEEEEEEDEVVDRRRK